MEEAGKGGIGAWRHARPAQSRSDRTGRFKSRLDPTGHRGSGGIHKILVQAGGRGRLPA